MSSCLFCFPPRYLLHKNGCFLCRLLLFAQGQDSLVESSGVPIDLPGLPRSRPFVCYWTGDGHFGPIDGYLDVLIGAADGKVHLYRGIPTPGDIDRDGGVDFVDFALFAAYWRQIDCGQCGGADLTDDGKVAIDDLRRFTENWLIGLGTPFPDTPLVKNSKIKI